MIVDEQDLTPATMRIRSRAQTIFAYEWHCSIIKHDHLLISAADFGTVTVVISTYEAEASRTIVVIEDQKDLEEIIVSLQYAHKLMGEQEK